MTETTTRTRVLTGLVIAAALGVLAVHLPGFGAAVRGLDEGNVLAYPDRSLDGAVPYRDYVTFYGPANPYVIAAAMGLLGRALWVERTVGLLYHLAFAVAIYRLPLVRDRLVRLAVAVVVGLAVLPAGLLAGAYVAAGALLVLGVGLARRRAGWAGVCIGLAALFRPDFLIAGALATAVLLWGRPRRDALRWAAGVAVGLALYVLIVVIAGPDAVVSTVKDLFRSSPGRRLPIPIEASKLGAELALTVLGPWALIVIAVVIRRSAPEQARLTAAVGAACVGLTPYWLSRADQGHLMLPVALAGCALLMLLWERALIAGPARPRIIIGGVAAFVALVLVAGTDGLGELADQGRILVGLSDNDTRRVSFGDRSVLVDEGYADSLDAMLAEVRKDGLADQRVFIGPTDLRTASYSDTFLYFLLPDAKPASRYWELNPNTANRVGSSWKRDLEQADVLLLTSRYSELENADRKGVIVENGLNDIVQARFCRRLAAGDYQVWTRRSGASCPA